MSHEDGTPTTPTPGSGPWPTPDQAAAPQQPATPPAPPAAQAPYVSGYETPASTGPAPITAPYGAPPAPNPGYPGATGYPSAPAAPSYPGAPAAPYPGSTPGGTTGTDGVSIAALVTGLLFLGVVPIVLGIIGLGRTKRNGSGGRGLAIAGIVLGALEILASIVVGLILLLAYNAYQDQVTELRAECAAGEMASCDELYRIAWEGSDDQRFGDTCGGLTSGGTYCASLGTIGTDEGTSSTSPYTYGDDPTLDAYWDGCAAGDMAACDDLYSSSPIDSAYEDFANTCGNRIEFSFSCEGETF